MNVHIWFMHAATQMSIEAESEYFFYGLLLHILLQAYMNRSDVESLYAPRAQFLHHGFWRFRVWM